MSVKTTFSIRGRNPDVLTCIANLSNDEVFTPPEFANSMLDTLASEWSEANNGEDIFTNSEVKFLDPFTKSGVFLREITTRLTRGLESAIPDLEARVDHILTKQVFGIGVTELTSQLARRSLYCSKLANGEHSIAKSFKRPEGNIWFERTEHTWSGGTPGLLVMNSEGETVHQMIGAKCVMCGAPASILDRGDDAETYAYALLHADDVKTFIREIFGEDMHFDVIIGNPPYQFDDGGYGNAASPIYNKFVDIAKNLDPKMLCMVIPARWFSGGKGLDSFRDEMLNDTRLRVIQDYPDSSEVFPGVQIKGGICYFLWDRDNRGDCKVTTHNKGEQGSQVSRPLLEAGADVFIRYNDALPILKKIVATELGGSTLQTLMLPDDKQFQPLVSSSKPFGLRTFFQGNSTKGDTDVFVFQNGGIGYFPRANVEKNVSVIDAWKVFIPRAGSGSDSFPHAILGKPFVGEPGTISTETYNFIGPFDTKAQAENCVSYIQTRLMRFLVLLHKPTQDASRSVYAFVPRQNFDKSWTDEMLDEKYRISKSERSFIDSLIRPMELEVVDK
jgi:hypothetical protein